MAYNVPISIFSASSSEATILSPVLPFMESIKASLRGTQLSYFPASSTSSQATNAPAMNSKKGKNKRNGLFI
jgi:hypothetical protein